ncbi:C40 family peptidase [Paenibacillus sp. GCM10027628]|uniref:C40 family peptidase n=1 Tax=Paenibacillus sp. GCM10027628 TaxID=3273413 RepID=UPI00362AE516
MQAKKLKITLAIVLAGLIGSIIYYGENTKSAAALSLDGHTADQAAIAGSTAAPAGGATSTAEIMEQLSKQASQTSADAEKNNSKSVPDKSEAQAAFAQSSSSAKPVVAVGQKAATEPTSSGSKAAPTPVTETTEQSSPADSNTSATDNNEYKQTSASDGGGIVDDNDPVPTTKKVRITDAEIAQVVNQFEQIADSDENEPSWKRNADHLIVKGLGYLGTPYVFGAKTGQTDSFDCSSFLKYIFASVGVTLPRDSRQQSQRGTTVSLDQLREGDLVFFTTPKRKAQSGIDHIGHVAVYLGDGRLLHTFRPGIGVTVSELDGAWKGRFVTAKRVLN